MEENLKQWTDEKELHQQKELANRLNEELVSNFATLRLMVSVQDLPSIGVYYNNKIVELYKKYKEKQVVYYNSFVKDSVDFYLWRQYIAPAIQALKKYENKANILAKKFLNFEIKKNLQKYNDLSQQLLNFSLETDVEKAINCKIDDMMSQAWYSGGINDDIDKCNLELQKLGVNIKIKHRVDRPNYIPKEQSVEELQKFKDKLNDKLNELREKQQEVYTTNNISKENLIEKYPTFTNEELGSKKRK